MNATIITRTSTSFTLQVEVPYNDSMLDFEETLQERLNEAGVIATAEGLKQFDTDGSPITIGPVKFTTKETASRRIYSRTPYGVATVARHVYQSPEGGPTYCPLDRDARIVVTSTPRFAKVLSHKYAEFSSPRAQVDLRENHGRAVSRCLIQDVADAVAAAVLAKQEDWSYAPPKFEKATATVAISLDGTCLHLWWRVTAGGRRWSARCRSTTSAGRAAAHGLPGGDAGVRQGQVPGPFGGGVRACQGEVSGGPLRGDRRRGEGELGLSGTAYRRAGDRLLARCGVPGPGGGGPVPGSASDPQGVAGRCVVIRPEGPRTSRGAEWVLKRLRSLARERPWAKGDEDVDRAITYFANQSGAGRMDYSSRVEANEPIGSGVTEAACKVIVKQRLCGSGMKWTEEERRWCLSLRAFELYTGAVGPVLVEGRSVGLPRRSLSDGISTDFTSSIGRTRLVFDKYDELGTVRGVFDYLVRNKIRLGIRPYHRPNRGNLEWRRPNLATVLQVIRNPIYAGTYAYGRRPYKRVWTAEGEHTTRRQLGSRWSIVEGPETRPSAGLHHLDVAAIMPPSSRVVDPPPRRAVVSTPANHRCFPFEFGSVTEAG